MRNTFPELQPLGNITCPILNAIKNRIPVTLAILGQTYHVRLFFIAARKKFSTRKFPVK